MRVSRANIRQYRLIRASRTVTALLELPRQVLVHRHAPAYRQALVRRQPHLQRLRAFLKPRLRRRRLAP